MAYWRYVDDSPNIVRSIDPGVRLVRDEAKAPQGLEIQQELIEMDKTRPEDERTASFLSEIAHSLHIIRKIPYSYYIAKMKSISTLDQDF